MNHNKYMKLALKEANKAYKKNEVPIGAVIVKDNKVIAKAHNLRVKNNLTTSHAEILVIQKANRKLKSWRLDSCTLYVTIEPCPMCAGAIIQSRIKEVFYGARDLKAGVHSSVINLFELPFNHKVEVKSGILEEESAKIISKFFKKIREK
jgi:tRNA(adenine34) deaminase